MKKTIIAGAAALGLAVLPMAGVFAETVKDTVTLSVGKGCTMTTVDNNNSGTEYKYDLGLVSTGADAELGAIKGTDMIISCNSANGWGLSVNATALTGTGDDINFGAYSTSGASVWSMQLESSANVTIASAWNSFGTAKTNGEAVSGEYVANGKITPYYKAYVKEGQADGVYTGTVTYTFAEKDAPGA